MFFTGCPSKTGSGRQFHRFGVCPSWDTLDLYFRASSNFSGNVCVLKFLSDFCLIVGAGRDCQGEQPQAYAEAPTCGRLVTFGIKTQGFVSE